MKYGLPPTPMVATTSLFSASITLTELESVLTTYTSLRVGLIAMPVGLLPTGIVFAVLKLRLSMTLTSLLFPLVTYVYSRYAGGYSKASCWHPAISVTRSVDHATPSRPWRIGLEDFSKADGMIMD